MMRKKVKKKGKGKVKKISKGKVKPKIKKIKKPTPLKKVEPLKTNVKVKRIKITKPKKFEIPHYHTIHKEIKAKQEHKKRGLFVSAVVLVLLILIVIFFLYRIGRLEFLNEISLSYNNWFFYVVVGLIVLVIVVLFLKFKKSKEVKEITKEKEIIKKPKKLGVLKNYIKPKGAYETDLDVLYNALKQRGSIRLSEIKRFFKIDEKKAEEWCNTLVEHDLAILHYPAIGEAELRCKQSKNIK